MSAEEDVEAPRRRARAGGARAPRAATGETAAIVIIVATCAAWGDTAAAQDARLIGAGEWSAAGAPIRVQVTQSLAAQAARLRFVAAGVDVTALARQPQPGLIEIDPRAAGLAPGEHELVVYLVEERQWREVARAPLKRLTRNGFESASATPKLDLAGKSQFAEETQGGASAPPRPHFTDLTGRGSVGVEARRGAFAFDASFNGAGSSYRAEALRYGEQAAEASKVDLADYRMSVRQGGTTLAVGHLALGSNPLLLDGFASRGLSLAQRFGERVELSVGAANGTSIVGTDNFFGLREADHRVVTGGVGVELLPRAGALRADLLYLDASVQSRGNFNVGEVPDAEKSHGFGVRLAGASEGNRVRGQALFARSTYVNPFDPQLAQGGASQAVRPATANGYRVELGADLLRDSALLSSTRPLTVTATVRHERVAPLFRSMGASLAADQRVEHGSLGASFAGAQLQFARQRQRDNLDDIPTLLATRTDSDTASATLPLPQWLGADAMRSLWPGVNLQWQRVRQVARNTPPTADSGFAASHRPDQLNRQASAGLNWSRERWTFGYTLSRSAQDNRQPGRELADFETLGHQAQASLRLGQAFNVTLGLQHNRNSSREKDLTTTTDTGNVGFDWTVRDRWAIAAHYARTLGDDSRELAASADRAVQAQLGYRFAFTTFGHKLPGQVFVRYSEHASSSRDATFGLAGAGLQRTWGAGLSLSLF